MKEPIAAFAFASVLLAASPGLAAIEYVPLKAPCAGKQGLAVADYSWFAGNAPQQEYVFTEVCVDLDRMRVFSVEDSDPFVLAFEGPGQAEYHSYPPGYTDQYRETMTLFTDVLDAEATHEEMLDAPDPEAVENIAAFSWLKQGTVRPLDRRGLASVWLRGFVGGVEASGPGPGGRYRGWGSHMVSTYKENAGLSGLGFALEGEVSLAGDTGSVRLGPSGHASLVKQTELTLTLHVDGNRISGTGRFVAENANLAPANGKVWQSFDMQTTDVVGRVLGGDEPGIYVIAVFEGSYTNHAGEVLRATTAMSFYGERLPGDAGGTDGAVSAKSGQAHATD